MAFGQTLTIKKGDVLRLPEKSAKQYNQFLSDRREALLKNVAGLKFPKSFSDLREVLGFIEARESTFPNRQVHCNFLNRIFKDLGKSDQSELKKLTNNFKYCIPADLPSKQEAEKWDFKMWTFLWEKPWVVYEGNGINLPEYIKRKMNLESIGKFKLIYWSNPYPDAGYSSLSSSDLNFIKGHSTFASFFDRIQSFDINKESSLLGFPNEILEYSKKDTLNFVDVFAKDQNMYFNSSWGPADMVDTLIHEYGHIHFDMKHGHFSKTGNKIVYEKDRVHDEACAETLSWILLRDLYGEYPEIEFSHIFKQYAFSSLRPTDPHYIGAGAAYFIFKDQPKDAIKEYEAMASATDFKKYIEAKTGLKLIKDSENPTRTVPLN